VGTEEAPTLFVRRASGLVRTVGPFTAFMIVFTHTVGGGIHRLAVIAAYQHPAAFVPYSFLITGLRLGYSNCTSLYNAWSDDAKNWRRLYIHN